MWFFSLSLWERAGERAYDAPVTSSLTLTLSQRERELVVS